MAKEAAEGAATPAVVPAYGEADGEAASMSKAAQDEEGRGQAGMDGEASDVRAGPVPDDAGPVSHGTTETDVKKRIGEAAAREASKAVEAG